MENIKHCTLAMRDGWVGQRFRLPFAMMVQRVYFSLFNIILRRRRDLSARLTDSGIRLPDFGVRFFF